MPKWYLTFGQKYRREPHPIGMGANPDGYVEVHAPDEAHARSQVVELIGDKWSMLYTEDEFFSEKYAFEEMRTVDYFPAGRSGIIRDGKFNPPGEDRCVTL